MPPKRSKGMPVRRRAANPPSRRPLPSKGSSARSVPKAKATPGPVNQALTGLAAAGGGFLGNAILPGIGGKIGTVLGYGAARLVSKITGHGAYTVTDNTVFKGQVPEFANSGNAEISFREYLGDVSGSTAFTTQYDIPINPGLPTSFPWASTIAANYEQYELLGMVFEYKATSADALNSTNTALGTVIATTQYDVQSPVFTTKQQAEDYLFACSTKPSASMLHPVECAPGSALTRNKYCRAAGVPSGYDKHLYDHANFRLYTVGMQATAVIGELWVTYHFKLKNAKLPSSISYGAGQQIISTISTSDPWQTVNSNLGVQYFSITSPDIAICLIGGVYTIDFEYSGASGGYSTGMNVDGQTATVVAGCQATYSVSPYRTRCRWYVTATAGQYVQWSQIVVGATPFNCYTVIQPYAAALVAANH